MAKNTFSMIPSVFSVSLKNVGGRIAFAGQSTVLPAGLTSRGQRSLPPQSPSLMQMRYRETAMPYASWPADRRPGGNGCNPTKLGRLTKTATKG